MATVLPPLPNKSQEQRRVSEKFDEGLEEVDAQRIITILNEAEKKFALMAILPQTLDKKVVSVLTIDTVFHFTVNIID